MSGPIDRDALARQLGIPPADQAALDSGSAHPYACRCEVCRRWWRLMGADPDTGRFGPFTREEVMAPPLTGPETEGRAP